MKVTFWGTRGSIAKPGPTTVRYGGNTSCIEVRSDAGDLVVLDCGTGGHGLGNALMAEMAREKKSLKGSILITHTHWDHIQGVPFFVPLYVPGNEWDVYGPRGISGSLRESLAGQMQYTYFPVDLDYLGSSVNYRDLVEGTFRIGNIKVTAQYMNHPCLTLGYRLECDGVAFVYACDHEPHSQEYALGRLGEDQGKGKVLNAQDLRHMDFLRGADLVVHDAQYTREEYEPKVGWGHCPMECAIDMCRRSGVKALAISHHDPMHTDDQLEEMVDAAMRTMLGRPLMRRAGHGQKQGQQQGQGGEEQCPLKDWDSSENDSVDDDCRKQELCSCLDVIIAEEGKTVELKPMFDGNEAKKEEKCSFLNLECDALANPALQEHVVLIGISNDTTATRLQAVAEADKMRVIRVYSANEVLRTVKAEKVSLVLLADGISKKDEALEMCRAIRKLGDENHFLRTMPVVLVPDDERPDLAADHAETGVTDVLVASFTDQYARTRIRAWSLRCACRWKPAPPCEDEAERMRSLHRLRILDTEPEERFDKLTRIASKALDVPIALVSLVDDDRQWFKSTCGISASETPRDQAFCAHAIRGREPFVVNDTLADDRFAENPLVTGGPRIRFYAGYPLRLANGTCPGTLCIIDSKPRDLDEGKLDLLKELGGMVEKELVAIKPPGLCKGRWLRRLGGGGHEQIRKKETSGG